MPGIRDMSARIARHERAMRVASWFSFISGFQMGNMLLVILTGGITTATIALSMA
jgi:hypothetical protein